MVKTIKCLLLVCLMLLVVASQTLAVNFYQPSLSAEALLGNLAQTRRTNRILGGVTLTALGIGTAALVSTIDSEDYNNEEDAKAVKTFGYVCTGIIIGGGVITLALPSEAENHHRDVKIINDPVARENTAYGSLVYLAEKAKSERLLSGAVSAGAAFYYLFAADPVYYYDGTESNFNTYWGLGCAAGAVVSLFTKSVEEKMLDKYERGQGYAADEGQQRHQLRMGWLPNGSVSAVYSYKF